MKKPKLVTPIILILLLVTLVSEFTIPVHAAGENWLSGWTYRKSHVVNNATGAGTNYQVQIVVINGSLADSGNTVYINNKTNSDFGDVRFTEDDGNTTINYWMEKLNSGLNATFWVKIADNLDSAAQTIYIYYGRTETSSLSNGDNTFILFDDFLGTSLNSSRWLLHNAPTVAVAGGIVTITYAGAGGSFRGIYQNVTTYPTITLNQALRMSFNDVVASFGAIWGMDQAGNWATNTTGFFDYTTGANPNRTRTYSLGVGEDKWNGSLIGWHIFEIERHTSYVTFREDDVGFTNHTIANTIPQGGLTIYLDTYTLVGKQLQCDWILVRKWQQTEPSHGAWGTEETEPVVVVAPVVTTAISPLFYVGMGFFIIALGLVVEKRRKK